MSSPIRGGSQLNMTAVELTDKRVKFTGWPGGTKRNKNDVRARVYVIVYDVEITNTIA